MLTISKLRADIYRIVDEVLRTGQAVEVERKGRVVRIVPVSQGRRIDGLTPHPGAVVGDPEELVHLDWSDSWRP